MTDSTELADKIEIEIAELSNGLARKEMINSTLSNSSVIVLDSCNDIVDFANGYGAEHLIIAMENAWNIADQIRNAGSVFVGNYSAESAGDYASGTNHTLPTGGQVRSRGGVNLDSFMRKITFQELSREGLRALSPTICTMAQAEGLSAHSLAIEIGRAHV